MVRALEPFDLELVEQPLPPREILDGLAFVRAHVGVPIMVDESVFTPRDAMEVILAAGGGHRERVRDRVRGAPRRQLHVRRSARRPGIPRMIGSMPEFGLGTAAQIHLGVAMTNLGPDSDTCGVLGPCRGPAGRASADRGRVRHPPPAPGSASRWTWRRSSAGGATAPGVRHRNRRGQPLMAEGLMRRAAGGAEARRVNGMGRLAAEPDAGRWEFPGGRVPAPARRGATTDGGRRTSRACSWPRSATSGT